MKINKTKIEDKIAQILGETEYFLVELVFRGDDRHTIIELYVDTEKGVSTEGCAKISRELGSFIDEEEIVKNYRLDVSSPGLGRPLKFIQQFPKHLNRKFKISYSDKDQTIDISGILLKVDGENLIFKSKREEVTIDFNNIITAKVEISFWQRRLYKWTV